MPLGLVAGSYPALQLRRERRRVAADVLEQARVPHAMKVIRVSVKDHVPRVAAVVAVVFIMQRLVQVGDEMNNEFEGPCLRVLVRARVFQDGEELFRLGDHAIFVMYATCWQLGWNALAPSERQCGVP